MLEVYGHYQEGLKLADLHIHCKHNLDDGQGEIPQIVDQAVEMGLSAIAITSHDTYEPSLLAREYARSKGYALEVVLAAEITTTFRRHILAYFLDNYIRKGDRLLKGKKPEDILRDLHRHYALGFAAHPNEVKTPSLGKRSILHLCQHPDPEVYLDGIEVYNRELPNCSQAAVKLQHKHFKQLRGVTAGSDAHLVNKDPEGKDNMKDYLGGGLVAYKGDLKLALRSGEVAVINTGTKSSKQVGQIARHVPNSMSLPLRHFAHTFHWPWD